MMKALPTMLLFLAMLGNVVSYAQDGSLDTGFGGGDGLVTTAFYANHRSQGTAIAVQEDGKILVTGYSRAPDGTDYAIVLRYHLDGLLDNSFNGNGKILLSHGPGYAQSILVQPDQKIVVAQTTKDSAETKISLHRFLENGIPDNTFGSNGTVHIALGAKSLSARALAIQADGKILVGGYVFYQNDLFDRFYVARYLTNGLPDNSFDGDGIVITTVGDNYTSLNKILVQPDGKIIAVGYGSFNGSDDYAVVRYHGNGSLDHSFSDDGIASVSLSVGEDIARGAALQPDSKIVMGGSSFNVVTSKYEFSAARLNFDGTPDNSFNGDGKVIISISDYSDSANSLLLQPDGKILIAGYAHSAINGGSDMAIVRLDENGVPDLTFKGDGVAVYADNETISSDLFAIALQPDGKLAATGWEWIDGLHSIRVARFNIGLTTSITDPDITATEVALFPNPITEIAQLQYELKRDEIITISLNDLQGRIVQRLLSASPRAFGSHTEKLNIQQSLPPGIYLVNLQSERWLKSMKVVIE